LPANTAADHHPGGSWDFQPPPRLTHTRRTPCGFRNSQAPVADRPEPPPPIRALPVAVTRNREEPAAKFIGPQAAS
jgi:hypothetical protein